MLFLLLLVLAAGLGALPASLSAGIATPTVSSITVEPKKVPADGGIVMIEVSVSLDAAAVAAGGTELRLILTTTLGAFGSASGPNRVSVDLDPAAAGEAVATALLVGDGRQGSAAVTARVADSTRAATVTFVGDPAEVSFDTPGEGAVLSADSPPRLIVQVRDSEGVTVADESVSFSTDAGELFPPTWSASGGSAESGPASAGVTGSVLVVRTDANGRASVFLNAEPGPVSIRASAGSAAATLSFTMHGPPARLELTALREAIHLGDSPFQASEGTLVAVLFDDGGRPVPRVEVSFSTTVEGVTVVQSGEGESDVTDASGRAAAYVSAAGAEQPGAVTILAEAAGHQASVEIQVVGPPETLALTVTSQAAGTFLVEATLSDVAGTPVPTGYIVYFSAEGVQPGDDATFDPRTVEALGGVAQTTFILSGVPEGVSIRAFVVDIEVDVSGTAPLPAVQAVAGISLVTGLNLIAWSGQTVTASVSLAPIAGNIVAVWRFDSVAGWQGYFPGPDFGVDFLLNYADPLAVFARLAVVWPLP